MAHRVLITGGAGFIGSNLCVALARRHPDWEVTAADNLLRRGSERSLPRLRDAGVRFAHADVRVPEDLAALGPCDALVECSAEPSVLGEVDVVVPINLLGAHHCFRHADRHGAQVIFLSTSRVYPVAALEALAWEEAPTRFELAERQEPVGASARGVAEELDLRGARTHYGASKLAAEVLLAEHEVPWSVLRCGVVSGPWQMGKVDQGIVAHWVASHLAGEPLRYLGYGGTGKQVRDVLHVDDLVDLVERQLVEPERWSGTTFNVGGGRAGSVSLQELTALCVELCAREVPVAAEPAGRRGDVRIYLTDCSRLHAHTDWRARRTPRDVVADVVAWSREAA